MSSPNEAAEHYISALVQHILDHLVELVRNASDLAELVIALCAGNAPAKARSTDHRRVGEGLDRW
jgi:hypothetical protein